MDAERAIFPLGNTRLDTSTDARLTGLRIRSGQITTDPIAIKSAWPYYLPTSPTA